MLELTTRDETTLAGERGEAARLALRIVVRAAGVLGAERLLDVSAAHIDGCLYHGQASLDFAERLVAGGGRVAVPTTLNVGSLDLLHPHLYRGDPATARAARRLMDAYVALGCRPTWTCAPYQLPERPGLGDQIAWAESNAIVFANSVLGARTNRYGDFLDICAAITGRVPDVGLHRAEGRRGELLFALDGVPERLLHEDVLYPVLGHLIGKEAGGAIPIIAGLPATTGEDQLKALGAAAASSGAVALFHAVGVTPEAPTLAAALGDRAPARTIRVTPALLARARDELTTARALDAPLAAVSLGTPHFSVAEFAALVPLLAGERVHPDVELYVSTGREVLAEIAARGWQAELERAGVRLLTDTCTYITPILRRRAGLAMTNSAKWAYYAPGNLGVEVVFGSLRECARSAIAGRVWRDPDLWAWEGEAAGGRGADRRRDSRRSKPAAEGSAGEVPRRGLGLSQPAGAGFAGGRSHPQPGISIPGTPSLAPGRATGEAIVLDEPLSFWGGFDATSGRITDQRHPQAGESLTGRVLVMPTGRGSSSSSSVLAEAIRAGTAPAAIVLRAPDLIVALGAIVAAELYDRHLPIVVAAPEDYAALRSGATVAIEAGDAAG